MANYAIRVELKGNPTYDEYETLHALMAEWGFYRTVDGVDGKGNQKSYDLPHAVYYGSSNSSCGTVRDQIRDAVKSEIQEKIIVFVVEAGTWALGW
jgi:hypothetical protein